MAGETQTEPGTADKSAARPKSNSLIYLGVVLAALVLALGFFFVEMPQTPLEKAISLIKANKAAAALPILEDLAQKQPDSSLYLPWLAQCYLSTDRLAEGRTALDTAIKLKTPCTTITPIVLNFSAYYRQKSDFSEAERLLNSTAPLCPTSDFQEERKSIYTEWAEDESKRGETAQAISHLEMLAAMDTERSEKQAHTLAELYRQQAAIEETQHGNDNKAIQLLEKSLTVADEPASRMALGNLYSKNGDLTHAVIHLKQVCKTDPNNLEARHKLVEMLTKVNDYQGAQEAASELAERERCVENYQLLASIDLKLGNYAGAVRALEEASSLAPKDIEVMGNLETALTSWVADLVRHGKQEESITVRGRAERIAETIKALEKELNPEAEEQKPTTEENLTGGSPLSLASSRIWLSKSSVTPEGEIKLKNTGNEPLEVSLTVSFYDKTSKKRSGSVTVSAAGSSHPMLPGQTRVLYFSSPNTVRPEHQLSVLIYWKGKLIRELPVVKER